MSSLISQGGASGTGSMTILAPNTNSNQTLTLPDATGTVLVSGAQPAFSAYPSVAQSFSNISYTKVQFNTKEFDTANAYDNVTNYRFTPQVAGYYQVNGSTTFAGTGTLRNALLTIYKNGSAFKQGEYAVTPSTNDASACSGVVSALVYLNGTTDYIELYGWVQILTGTCTLANNANASYFQAILVRTA